MLDKLKFIKFLPSLFILLVCVPASAGTLDERDLENQRKLFVKAEGLAHLPKSRDYNLLKTQLQDYPLQPYIELKTLMNFPYLSNKDKIENFLNRFEGSPMDKPLRSKWLTYLANKNQQALFLHFYRDVGDDELLCKQMEYRLNREDLQKQALEDIDALWLVGESQPQQCDVVFERWFLAGRRTNEIVWKRLILAADGGKHTLIPYLKSLLPQEDHYLADLWLKVRRTPNVVSRSSNFPGIQADKESEIISYGLGRLVWQDRDLALKSWQVLNKRFTFTKLQQQHIAGKFAVALANDNHPQAELWLERANSLVQDEELSRWHLAHVLRKQDWPHVLDVIDAANDEISHSYSYQYWRARGYEQLDAPEQANQSFVQLAEQRHYYGFMASGKLAQSPNMVDVPLVFSPMELQAVIDMPAAKRAYEFLQLKRYTSARREWIFLQSQISDEQSLMAAVLADSWGWHDQAIFTLGRVGYLDDIKRRFPMAYSEQLLTTSEQNQVDPAWAFAIARRESSFMVDANSGAGARGLMQLMPSTARYLAKSKISNNSLYDPAQNVQYGTQYLRYLMDKTDNNPVLATASYNAGWSKVRKWLPEQGSLPMDIWVETIPYKETRNYVKAVLAYKQIYTQRLGRNTNLFADLAAMQISSNPQTY
jgi:soluble lytic murein transglycosylase